MACGIGMAEAADMTVEAVVLSKNACTFRNVSSLALNFGGIDPSLGVSATANTSFTIRCMGSDANATFAVTANNGLWSTGPGVRRMRHTTITTQFLSYSVSFTPAAATVPKNTDQVVTATGTVLPSQSANAQVGAYADTLTVTVSP
jgi:spore coat protein U-like protein